MLKVGLTGGMACGKSTVGEMFVQLGAHLIQADLIGHQLMLPGQSVYEEVVRHFGPQILNADRTIHRAQLAEAAFGGDGKPSRIEELNCIVHPAVIRHQEQWMEEVGRADPHAIAIVEAALILESHTADRFDKLIVVTCDEEQRAERFARRQELDMDAARAEVRRRMAAQLPDSEKIKAADFVIDNSGPLEATERQVREVWRKMNGATVSS